MSRLENERVETGIEEAFRDVMPAADDLPNSEEAAQQLR